MISLYQEVRAKRTLDRIAILTRPHAVVVRDGREREVDPAELVVGDTIRAQSGDQIVVDGRVVGPGYLEIDESLLTGESDLVVKRAGDAVLSGSFCVAGSGYYEAETVGAESFANKVTATAQTHRRFLTPLQHQANVLVWILLVIALAFVALVVTQHFTQHLPWVETMQATTVIVGLVPNSLILAIVLAYALGAVRMAGKGALIQEANAVESLSNVDVLCTDKTGTLTTNVIRLRDLEPLEAPRDELERLLCRLRGQHRGAQPHDRGARRGPAGARPARRRRGRLLVEPQVERPRLCRRRAALGHAGPGRARGARAPPARRRGAGRAAGRMVGGRAARAAAGRRAGHDPLCPVRTRRGRAVGAGRQLAARAGALPAGASREPAARRRCPPVLCRWAS